MGNIVMPKQSADKDEMEAVLSVYIKHNNWITNSILIADLKNIIGNALENQAYTKKAQIPAYFGLIEWEEPASKTSRKKITQRGIDFYNALQSNNQDNVNQQIIKSLEELNFGRNVHGCSSDSDIEPPKVFVKALFFLNFFSRKEYGFILWQMDVFDSNLLDLMSKIKSKRLENDFSYSATPNKYNDAKPITVLYNWGLFESDGNISGQEKIILNKSLSNIDLDKLLKLNVKNNLVKEFSFEEDEDAQDIEQKIFYGAPGTGKSHKVNNLVKGKDSRMQRVTFHPEYDYASFVGGYKPTMGEEDGKEVIKYKFVPQAFTNIYVKAWNDVDNDYYLVIEEINRGNCAEIFGDIFQLLDRDSDYDITPSIELESYLKSVLTDENKGLENGKLKLPNKLTIYATMNTSDQSLFPMDSAFKRRWDWEYIPICYEELTGEGEPNSSFDYVVDLENGKSFKWNEFISKVNLNHIQQNSVLGMDKCMGNYFVKPKKGQTTIDLATFINKAIFYLWNDVFKDEKNEVFEENSSYEDFFPINTKGVQKLTELLERIEVTMSITPEV